MGYSHYFIKKRNVTENEFKEFSNTCKKLFENLPEKTNASYVDYHKYPLNIADWNGDGEPIFSEKYVSFNGENNSEYDLSHESFSIAFYDDINRLDYIKTNHKPYDLLVVSCLIAAWQILDYQINSDSINKHENGDRLKPAINFYNKTIKPNKKIKLENIIDQSKNFFDDHYGK